MSIEKNYDPAATEIRLYQMWEASGAFACDVTSSKPPYTIMMPPPNVTGSLHMGHALTFTLQDILVRYHRMKGYDVLWQPGTDHAGIATQMVVERQLAAQKLDRRDMGREAFLKKVWEWKAESGGTITKQLRRLGASCDWSRERFTMDEGMSRAIMREFVQLYRDGLIFRDKRLVNWDPKMLTAVSDLEVEQKEVKGNMWYFRYPLEDDLSTCLVIATTRPETMLGDGAVAVHPDDDRYKHLVGRRVMLPLANRLIPIIADEYSDPTKGTGAVKITPAHDFNDYEVSLRHNLPGIRVINHDGTMNHLTGEFEGLTVAEARKAVAKKLKEKDLLVRIDTDYKNRVGTCYKCGSVIEPMLLDQWFIDMKKLASPAVKALKNKEIVFYPEAKREQVITYLESVKDWNISRQIAWGIPIPAFQNVEDSDDWIFNTQVDELEITVDGKTYRRDPDVFDTWFSSSQWPFVTLDYPDSEDFKKFYPNTVMETGQDILYQWVARMICLGLYVTGEIPFKNVYLHGMVRSEDGRKMSKSLGNVIDPKEVLEAYGADAIRMGILSGRSAGYSAAYAPGKIIAGRNFCNKLWNIARYAQSEHTSVPTNHSPAPKSIADHWILSRLTRAQSEISKLIEDYRFSEAYEVLYHFIWNEVADWYIEASKGSESRELLHYVINKGLQLAHPFAPFVTETIWQQINPGTYLITTKWETVIEFDPKKAEEFNGIQAIVLEIRAINSSLGIKKVPLEYKESQLIKENDELLKKLARLSSVNEAKEEKGVHLATTTENCWLAIDETITRSYLLKLQDRIRVSESSINQLQGRLSNESYTRNAPKKIVEQTQEALAKEMEILKTLKTELENFSK